MAEGKSIKFAEWMGCFLSRFNTVMVITQAVLLSLISALFTSWHPAWSILTFAIAIGIGAILTQYFDMYDSRSSDKFDTAVRRSFRQAFKDERFTFLCGMFADKIKLRAHKYPTHNLLDWLFIFFVEPLANLGVLLSITYSILSSLQIYRVTSWMPLLILLFFVLVASFAWIRWRAFINYRESTAKLAAYLDYFEKHSEFDLLHESQGNESDYNADLEALDNVRACAYAKNLAGVKTQRFMSIVRHPLVFVLLTLLSMGGIYILCQALLPFQSITGAPCEITIGLTFTVAVLMLSVYFKRGADAWRILEFMIVCISMTCFFAGVMQSVFAVILGISKGAVLSNLTYMSIIVAFSLVIGVGFAWYIDQQSMGWAARKIYDAGGYRALTATEIAAKHAKIAESTMLTPSEPVVAAVSVAGVR